ncbi:MAG: ABC transporter permease [Acidocella sp. 20-63-7]|nr:MAG: ABC transporter permease [Acidocella sp. 20-63-7]HQT46639.1 ABC transporter permease [Acidocella sp.]
MSAIPRRIQRGLLGISLPVYLLLYTPLLIIAVFSFTPSLGHPGMNVAAYGEMLNDPQVMAALRRSLTLALSSAVLGTLLGTLMGFGLSRYRPAKGGGFWVGTLPSLIIYLPIIMPSLVFGISEMIFFNFVHQYTGLLSAGLLTMGIAHVTFQAPYVALVVYARLAGLDPNLFEASHDLYANPFKSFVYLTIPVVRPALIGGFLLAITLSIDDFTISFFTAGPGSVTLPIYIYGAIARKGSSPEINAIGTLMIATVVGVALLYYFVSRHRERSNRIPAVA